MGSNLGNVDSAGGVPPSGGPEDSRDVREASRGGCIGLFNGARGIGYGGDAAYEGIHFEAAGYHCIVHHKPTNL